MKASTTPARHSDRGFTLIEVILALLVMSLCFTSAYGLFTGAAKVFKKSLQQTQIACLARSKMTEIENGLERARAGRFTEEPDLYWFAEEEKFPDRDLKRVVLTIQWTTERREPRSYSVETLVPDYEK